MFLPVEIVSVDVRLDYFSPTFIFTNYSITKILKVADFGRFNHHSLIKMICLWCFQTQSHFWNKEDAKHIAPWCSVYHLHSTCLNFCALFNVSRRVWEVPDCENLWWWCRCSKWYFHRLTIPSSSPSETGGTIRRW